MELLVLGGTRFVGRAVIEEALTRGWRVTALHRGRSGAPPAGVASIRVDRTDAAALAAALEGRRFDLAVDTWAGAPAVAAAAAGLLRGRVGRFGYVSSGSVYVWGEHVDERSPVVDADADAVGGEDYAVLKRGCELAVVRAFPDAVLARAGLILGPHEDVGRLPWWLARIARGGPVVAPGRPDRPLQYVDARDLAAWLLGALDGTSPVPVSGAVDVIGPSGFATTAQLLETCVEVTGSDAVLRWFDEQALGDAGVEQWAQLPCWVPETGEFAGFLEVDTALAASTGLRPRPLRETVADTWRWLQTDGPAAPHPLRAAAGLPAELERALLG